MKMSYFKEKKPRIHIRKGIKTLIKQDKNSDIDKKP